jgi:hypothetical protein
MMVYRISDTYNHDRLRGGDSVPDCSHFPRGPEEIRCSDRTCHEAVVGGVVEGVQPDNLPRSVNPACECPLRTGKTKRRIPPINERKTVREGTQTVPAHNHATVVDAPSFSVVRSWEIYGLKNPVAVGIRVIINTTDRPAHNAPGSGFISFPQGVIKVASRNSSDDTVSVSFPKKKRSSGQKRDFMEVARGIVEQAIGEKMNGSPLDQPEPDRRNPHAVALGSMGGRKGGKARAKALSPSKRRAIAKKAAKSRWKSSK